MPRYSRFVPFALGLTLMTGLAGCSLLGEGDDDDDVLRDDRISTRDRDRASDRIGRDRDLSQDARNDRGLEEEMRRAGIPLDAQYISAANGEDLAYTAPEDGTIYVQDRDDNDRLIYSGRMNRNERFRFDSDAARFMIEGRTVLDREVSRDHKYRMFFDRE